MFLIKTKYLGSFSDTCSRIPRWPPSQNKDLTWDPIIGRLISDCFSPETTNLTQPMIL
jgi:hypothetical protein